MSAVRWDAVLVDWVNCLKLSEPIKNLKELNDGLFYRNLFKILIPDQINEVSDDIIITLYNFVKTHYPEYNFELEKSDLTDLNQDEIIVFTSLLMHFSCLRGRQDNLIQPLCSNLFQNVQVVIRAFLEEFPGFITREKLEKFLSESMNVETEMTPYAHFKKRTPDCMSSPLEDLLRTPKSRSRIISLETRRLKAALEDEKYEKSILQEDFKAQQEKIQKLNEQFKEKCCEISRLRSELVALENREPPYYQADGSAEIQRRYQSEIQDLERFISQLQNEQEILQNEKDILKEKLKKSESQFKLFKDKFLSSELENDTLKEKCKSQETEINNLQVLCDELSAVLTEFKSKKNESCLEVDSSFAELRPKLEKKKSFEDLGKAVIDVQLQEANKENNELKSLLNEVRKKESILGQEVDDLKSKICILEEEQCNAEKENVNLLGKIRLLETSQHELEENFAKATKDLNNYKLQNERFEEEISLLNLKLQQSQEECEKYRNLESEHKALQEELGAMIEKYNSTDFELDALKSKYKSFDSSVEDCLGELAFIIFESRDNLDLSDRHGSFIKLIAKLKENIASDINDKKTLNSRISSLEEVCTNLKIEIEALQKKESEMISLREYDILKSFLKKAEEQSQILDLEVKRLEERIQEFEELKSEQETTISDLERSLEKRASEILDLQEGNHRLEEEISVKSNKEEELIKTIDCYEIETRKLQEQLEKKREEFKAMLEEMSEKNIIEKELNTVVEGLKSDKATLESELQQKTLIIDDNRVEIATQKENETKLKTVIEEFNQIILLKEEDIGRKNVEISERDVLVKKLEDNCRNLEEDLQKKCEKIEELLRDAGDLKTESEKFQTDLEECRNELTIFTEKNSQLEEKVKEAELNRMEEVRKLNDLITQHENESKQLRNSIEKIQGDYKTKTDELNEHIIAKEQEIFEKQSELNTLNKKLELIGDTVRKLETELEKTTQEKLEVESCLQTETKANGMMKQQLEEKSEEIQMLQEELCTIRYKVELKEQDCLGLLKIKDDLNQELNSLKSEFCQKDIVMKSLENDVKKLSSDISGSNQCVELLEAENVECKLKIVELESQIKVLNGLKEQLEAKCSEYEVVMEKIVLELSGKNQDYEKFVDEMKAEKTERQERIGCLEAEISEAKSKIVELNSQNNALISQHEKALSELQGDIESLRKTIEEKTTKEIEYIQEIRIAKDDLNDTMTKYTESLEMYQETKYDLEVQVNNLTENLHEVIEKYNKLDKEHSGALEQIQRNDSLIASLEEQKKRIQTEFNESREDIKKKYEEECENLYLEIVTLKSELKDKNSNQEKLEIRIKEIEIEIQALQLDYQALKENYKQLCLIHQNYKTKSEEATKEIVDNLEKEINKTSEDKSHLDSRLLETIAKMKELEESNEKLVRDHENQLLEKEEIIEKLQEKLDEYSSNIKRLTDEQVALTEQLEVEKANRNDLLEDFRESKSKLTDFENTIMKLKCANAILETGKEKLQIEHDKLLITINKLEESLVAKEANFSEEIRRKDYEISQMKSLVDSLQNESKDKQSLIEELRADLDLINKSLEQVKIDKLVVQDSLMDLKQNYKNTAENTKGVYESKLRELGENFEALKGKYETLTKELNEFKVENSRLKENVNALSEEKDLMLEKIRTKEDSFCYLQQELQTKTETISELEVALEESRKNFEEKVKGLSKILEEKSNLQSNYDQLNSEMETIKKSKDLILEAQSKIVEETEKNIQETHVRALETKNGLMKRIEIMEDEMSKEGEVRLSLEHSLEQEKQSKEVLNSRIVDLENEKFRLEQLNNDLKQSIRKLKCLLEEKPIQEIELGATEFDNFGVEVLTEVVSEIESRIAEIFTKKRELNDEIKKLQNEQNTISAQLQETVNEKNLIQIEKNQLMEQYEIVQKEKELLFDSQKDSNKLKEELESNYKCKTIKLESEVANINSTNLKKFSDYQELIKKTSEQKSAVEKLITAKNNLETSISNLRTNCSIYQNKKGSMVEENQSKTLIEKMQAQDIVVEEILKQFSRISKQTSNKQISFMKIVEKTMQSILEGKEVKFESIFADLDLEEVNEKLENLKDQVEEALEQQKSLEKSLESCNFREEFKESKVKKENLKEDDLKKKNATLKQRLTLAEHAKNSFEKKLKQLREENKKLAERASNIDGDQHYKILLQQHLQTKDQYEKSKTEFNEEYSRLKKEFEEYKNSNKGEDCGKLTKELHEVRTAYGNVLTEKSKLELDNSSLRKFIEDLKSQLSELVLVKDAYEKLLEDNNQLLMEIDTLKYKRSRDRDEYMRLLKKERDEVDNRESKKVQDIRMEYEGKLEKMKEKMIRLYKEEVDKEMKKVVVEKDENIFLLRTFSKLKDDLKDARTKIQKLELEKTKALDELRVLERQSLARKRDSSVFSSRESVSSITSRDRVPSRNSRLPASSSYTSFEIPSSRNVRMSTSSLGRESISRRTIMEERRISTLPRTVVEEVTISKHTSVNSMPPDIGKNFEMEDEGELFNNKYLADLKEGRCISTTGRESAANRMSELAFRNSLCPPHLKSSYPAETQFTSPSVFKEEDIKSGAIEFDDSMSSKLLPGEKPRNRKDIGTTSYKKPGPPTPSKNGGKMSLENKIHPKDVLRDQNDKTPKRSTPNRIKALFMVRNASARDNSENQPTTPGRAKRLSIFRKPR